jgi:hypothetical protein
MNLFRHESRQHSDRSRTLYARFELLYTAVDFSAAGCFILGSILFFNEETRTPGTWLFLVGSIFFAAKPTIRMIREIKLYRMGDVDDLAKRVKD